MLSADFLRNAGDALGVAKLTLSCLSLDGVALRPAQLASDESFLDIAQDENEVSAHLERAATFVDGVISARKRALVGNEKICNERGRFLMYSPLHSTMDALASGETTGFFDDSDAPPFTTWLGFANLSDKAIGRYEGYLVCWIPELFVSIADQGVLASLGKSLFWADDFENAHAYGERAERLCRQIVDGLR
jgi:hypothetical protein